MDFFVDEGTDDETSTQLKITLITIYKRCGINFDVGIDFLRIFTFYSG
jgi:hypothetical protein